MPLNLQLIVTVITMDHQHHKLRKAIQTLVPQFLPQFAHSQPVFPVSDLLGLQLE